MSAYLLAVCEITNPTENMKLYAQKSAALIEQHGGEYVVRGKAADDIEGDVLKGKVVILSKFPSLADVDAFVNGDEYQKNVKHLREGSGTYHVAIYEGV
jgi:uncharacterized protein (DUF1330 family)